MNAISKVARLIIVVMAAAFFTVGLAACDGNGEEATETPTATEVVTATVAAEAKTTPEPTVVGETPAPPPKTGGMDGFRAFARQIEQAVANKDAQFFIDRPRISEYTCPGEPAEMVDPRCAGQPGGTVIEGVWVGPWRSEVELLALDSLREDLAAYLESLTAPTLYAIGDRSSLVSDWFGFENAFYAVVASSDDPPNTMRVIEFEFSPDKGSWTVATVMYATGAVWAEEWLSGDCTDCYDHWERWEGAP